MLVEISQTEKDSYMVSFIGGIYSRMVLVQGDKLRRWISSEDAMYNIMTVGNSIRLYTWNLLRVDESRYEAFTRTRTHTGMWGGGYVDCGNQFTMFTYVRSCTFFVYPFFGNLVIPK